MNINDGTRLIGELFGGLPVGFPMARQPEIREAIGYDRVEEEVKILAGDLENMITIAATSKATGFEAPLAAIEAHVQKTFVRCDVPNIGKAVMHDHAHAHPDWFIESFGVEALAQLAQTQQEFYASLDLPILPEILLPGQDR